ncbi:MAG TPA: hypothetical protein PK303_06585 [bacterium]|nr:hypothetical protein [bacterium]HOL34506.1 hypothetical protein [bacterium]HPP08767.1 hypothetical protein [bacterium]
MNGTLDYIYGYLTAYRRIERKIKISEVVCVFLSAISMIFTILIFLDKFLPFSSFYANYYRVAFFLIVSGFVAWIFYTHWKCLYAPFDTVALKIEKKFPFLNNLVINSVQLSRKTGKYPEIFIEVLRKKAVQSLANCNIEKAIDRHQLKKSFIVTLLSLFLLTVSSVLLPQSSRNVLLKILMPGKFTNSIIVEPGNCSVERGCSIVIRAKLKEPGIPEIQIKNGTTKKEPMIQDGQIFVYTVNEVITPFSYRVVSNNKSSVWYGVNVVEKTLVKKMKLTFEYPSYTGLKPKTVEKGFSEISGPQGTKITAEFYFNNPAGDTLLVFGDGTSIPNKGISKVKSFKFTINNATFYQIHYYDPATKKTLSSPRERITVIFDQIPFCEFLSPGKDIVAKSGTAIPLKLKVSDDFGINSIRFRVHTGEGEISNNDRIFYQSAGNGRKDLTVDALLKVPAGYSKIAYYAECTDYSSAGNTGRSSIYFVYSPQAAPNNLSTRKSPEQDNRQQTEMEQAKKILEKFIEEQKKVIEAAKKLGKVKNAADPSELQNLAEQEKKWADMLQKMVNDLNKIAQQTQGKFTLSDEFVEMISHLQAASDAFARGKPITIPVQESQMGLELAEELVANLERWLAEAPDSVKWDLQEPSKPVLAPEAELPAELEDIIGDLIEQAEDMTEEIEDITSSWMDSLDKGAGWMAMDGSISNMSAKGITGNVLPNQQEIGGRSGEGRTGRSYGEMVEKTAQGKGGRQTPARLTPDNIEPGQVQDTSGENQLGPTGGGKASGWGPTGLKGPVQDLSFRYAQLAEKQAKLIEKAEKMERELKILNIYNPQIEKSISAMKQFTIQLKEGRYHNLLTTNQMIVTNLKQAQQVLTHQAIVRIENSEKVEKKRKELGSIWDEKIPSGYEPVVRKYYENISGR